MEAVTRIKESNKEAKRGEDGGHKSVNTIFLVQVYDTSEREVLARLSIQVIWLSSKYGNGDN